MIDAFALIFTHGFLLFIAIRAVMLQHQEYLELEQTKRRDLDGKTARRSRKPS